MDARLAPRVADLFSPGSQPVSFEIFPPKGELSGEDAARIAGELAELEPSFISVTYSAGGSGNARATTEVAAMIQDAHAVPTVAHLTCQGMTRVGLDEKVAEFRRAGIENVLALRGDAVPGAAPGDFSCAAELVAALVDAGFCVGAAAYPEGHIACESLDSDLRGLKAKQDAGASFFVTQLFFDNGAFYRFRERAERAGVTAPLSCGIMPFMSKGQVSRMVFMCGVSLPAAIVRLLARYEDDPASLRAAGVEYAAAQLYDLRDNGVSGLHLYTMNRPEVARSLVAALRG